VITISSHFQSHGDLPKVLMVGELNPYGSNPALALYHLPRNASGDRLRTILGLSDKSYATMLAKANLCYGAWDRYSAEKVADDILLRTPFTTIVLLGAKVREAFQGPPVFTTITRNTIKYGTKTLVGLPHPSGRCRDWYDPQSHSRARTLLKAVTPWLPIGEELLC
jgi:hypothetical protein